jgi:hypothetical protein
MSKNPFFARWVALERGWLDVYAKDAEAARALRCARELDYRRRVARGEIPSSDTEVVRERITQTARQKRLKVSLSKTQFEEAGRG